MGKQMTCDVDYAWAAGFFDGEGCTKVSTTYTVRRRGKYFYKYIGIQISQNDRKVLEKFQRIMGVGTIARRKAGNYVYYLNRQEDCHEVLEKMWPYLGEVKRQQANRVIDEAVGRFKMEAA